MRGRDELDRLVTGAHRRRLLGLAGECLILGAAALLSAATVAVLGGDEARRPAVWSAAALCGALIAASRWMGSGREKRETAHRLDRGLDMGGALTTACEPRAASPLRRLLVRRVAEGADGRRARGLFPLPQSRAERFQGLLIGLGTLGYPPQRLIRKNRRSERF